MLHFTTAQHASQRQTSMLYEYHSSIVIFSIWTIYLSNLPTSLVDETEFALRWLWGGNQREEFNLVDKCVCVRERERVSEWLYFSVT